ncbi:MAG: hypothetical protein KDA37_15860 [Planctomycetales bacterium]|nr:hypothetical protein [Planctomycetales bacterium]
MLNLHANVYAEPSQPELGAGLTLRGVSVRPLRGEGSGPPRLDRTMPVTFEAMQEQLKTLPRLDCEPDGFFLLTGHEAGEFWRLNGHMHEHAGRMHRVELNGQCPTASLETVLGTMGWPEAKLVFELVQEGVTLSEEDFRRWAAADQS